MRDFGIKKGSALFLCRLYERTIFNQIFSKNQSSEKSDEMKISESNLA
jgi:hypothetical protein